MLATLHGPGGGKWPGAALKRGCLPFQTSARSSVMVDRQTIRRNPKVDRYQHHVNGAVAIVGELYVLMAGFFLEHAATEAAVS